MDNHQSNAEQDAVFVRNFAVILGLLTVIGVAVYVLASWVNSDFRATQESSAAIAERLAPVGSVNSSGAVATVASTAPAVAEAAGAGAAPVASSPGEATYNKVCFACHAQGIAGAPKLGDADAWGPRIAQGVDTLHQHAIAGFQGKAGMMPAKGGSADLADEDVKAAVDFMVKAAQSGGKPAAAAAPAAAAPAAAAPAVADAGAKGKEVYGAVCFACHATGAAGAPKFGDKEAWATRIAQGPDTLHNHALNGFTGQVGMMPPKGGRPDMSDDDIKAAVDYMVSEAK
jgi:cytochrome c5